MIAGNLYQSSGLGNQLHRYVATRIKASELGVGFGMQYIPNDPSKDTGFKGKSFMEVDLGEEVGTLAHTFLEKKVVENGVDIRSFDPEFNFIEDNTHIEGEFQDPRYFEHRLDEIDTWLKVDLISIPDDVCVIGFRGGEYYTVPELGLPLSYYKEAMDKILAINPWMKFEVHTDDPEMAKRFFSDMPVIHDIGINWRSMRYAKYAIIANSSFFIFPRLLSKGITIAPRYWARRNTGVWALPSNYYKQFQYV